MNTNIQITVNGDKIVVNKGAVLSDILKSRGYRFAMPCGGRGICRKCKVSADGKEVLACKYIVTQPVDIVLPEFTDGKYQELIEKRLQLHQYIMTKKQHLVVIMLLQIMMDIWEI